MTGNRMDGGRLFRRLLLETLRTLTLFGLGDSSVCGDKWRRFKICLESRGQQHLVTRVAVTPKASVWSMY